MVAWDASRLATRAVNDAMPFLHRAKAVLVFTIDSRGEENAHGEMPGADTCAHLARDDVPDEARQANANDGNVGKILLSEAADQGVDLLVMGAYGHTRWCELVLGGATRHLLEHMTMSH